MSRPRFQRRSLPVHRDRESRTCATGRAESFARGLLLRLGHPHTQLPRGSLQCDVLSQWICVATRQRSNRKRTEPLWVPEGNPQDLYGSARCQPVPGLAPPPRTILWIPPSARPGSHPLSCCLLTAVVRFGRSIFDSCSLLGDPDPSRAPSRSFSPSGDALIIASN